jgi:hypothetical protein
VVGCGADGSDAVFCFQQNAIEFLVVLLLPAYAALAMAAALH